MIWIIFVLMTAAVIAALLRPAWRSAGRPTDHDRNAYDCAIFRDQLLELDRDVERGSIAASEADAARNEISRRLIAASTTPAKPRRLVSPAMALLSALIVPAIALPLYVKAGSPGLPGVPLAARLESAAENGDYVALIFKAEQHLAQNPDDLQGWKVLAPAYRSAERWDDAAEALRNILRLSKPNAATLADYGETLVMANQGLVPVEARDVFAKSLALDPKLPKSRFYDALALKQDGRTADAKAAFDAFMADTPKDAPWRPMLVAEMQAMAPRLPALDPQTMKDAASMSPADRQTMIRAMVDGLEEKLKADAGDLNGWLRLIRSRVLLGEMDKADAAYLRAKEQFTNNAGAMRDLAILAEAMGME